MEIALIIVGLVVVAAIVYFVTKKAPPPEIAAPPEPKKLQEKAKQPSEKPADKPTEKPRAQKKPPAEEAPPAKAKEPAPQEEPPAAPAPVEAPVAPPPAVAPAAPEPAVAEAPIAPAIEAPAIKPAAKPARETAPPAARKRDIEGLRKGLTKVRESEGFFGRLKALFAGKKEIDPNVVEQIEEVLLTSDVGVKTTELLLDEIRSALSRNELADTDKVWDALREHAKRILRVGAGGGLPLKAQPTVVMVVGVNGVGKTTTIGKLATQLKAEGRTVVLAAGDTFRAAAVQQLNVWGKRVGCEVVRGKDGANPGAVIFDAIQKAKDTGADVVLADTAGRLHTKTNLMEELSRVARTMNKALEGAPHETLLVLDATNGQNAMQQAALFKEALPITGIVLTKLDGTAKGGVILGICAEHGLPVRYVGIGERAEDLREFEPDEFVEAMLGRASGSEDAAA
ncbi:cell division membrane protein [Sorangium cellulosum So ce56]|uniref:Signal recognition particle receptor FtsY n=1 Tax=Sorangium cellulosum (strain So ce56) TaxID=448385 RepID=A9GEW9_SORC5|nr:signal recognition particle-docking protein FtsY [Sorangium cellulosum]CAN93067.1 cell division membrane protein [Sorangium cellulosum So ce56]